MKLTSTIFTTPKKGGYVSENEDYYFPKEPTIKRDHHSVAISDGASEGFMSRLWSKVLTICYVNWDTTEVNIPEYIDFCIEIYEIQKQKYLKKREMENKPLKWFEENLMAKGSFATLLGLSFVDSKTKGGHWKSYSIGDSCLIQLRENIITIFPKMNSNSFTNNPNLISTNPNYNKNIQPQIKTGEWRNGDTFYLMTDAIANWFHQEIEQKRKPWTIIDQFIENNKQGLNQFIAYLREAKKLKNDDVTIARVQIHED